MNKKKIICEFLLARISEMCCEALGGISDHSHFKRIFEIISKDVRDLEDLIATDEESHEYQK